MSNSTLLTAATTLFDAGDDNGGMKFLVGGKSLSIKLTSAERFDIVNFKLNRMRDAAKRTNGKNQITSRSPIRTLVVTGYNVYRNK